MSDDVQLQRDIGRMEGDISALRGDVAEMKSVDMAELKADMKAMRAAFSELKGGTRTLLGIASIVGAGMALFAQWLLGKHL